MPPRPIHLVLPVLLLLTACTTGGSPLDPTTPSPTSRPEGVYRMQGCEPRALLPAAVTSECGEQVVAALYTPLVELDPDDGRPRWGADDDRAVADRITTTDGVEWRIVLEEDWQFHDGQPVTAQSFVDAWNFAALETNSQPRGWLLEHVVGFDALRCEEAECTPESDELAGVDTPSEHVLEVTLDRPDHTFPRLLGHPALSPLPPTALEDPETFGQTPMGNGPFRLEGTWEHDRLIRLRRAEDHAGRTASSAGVDLFLFRDREEAREALLADEIELAAELDPEQVASVGSEFTTVSRPGDDYVFLVVPAHEEQLADDRLAAALSRAIDRRAIIDQHLFGAARPATSLVPEAAGGVTGTCGSACRFDPEAARELLAAADVPRRGIELWFDRSTDQQQWAAAVMEQWRRHLGFGGDDARLQSLPHDQYVAHLSDRRVSGLYALGWSMDVPTPEEYLRELHGTGGLFNFDGYRNEDVDRELTAARANDSAVLRQRLYRRAEASVLDDFHHVPLWVRDHQAVHDDLVGEVELDPWGRVLLDRVVVTE